MYSPQGNISPTSVLNMLFLSSIQTLLFLLTKRDIQPLPLTLFPP